MDDQPRIITRRDILRGAGLMGAAAVAAPASLVASPDAALAVGPVQGAARPRAAVREAYENLTATEADLLEAIVDRLIPSDALGPGAKEARSAHYIDRALGGALLGLAQKQILIEYRTSVIMNAPLSTVA